MRKLLVLGMVLLLAACGSSPPTHFYTLDAVPPKHAAASVAGHLYVANVNLPATLDRRAVVLRSGPNQIEVSDQARWAGPLDSMIRRVLAEDLAQRLGHGTVLVPGEPVPNGRIRTIVLTLMEFGGGKEGRVVVSGDWAVQDSGQKVVLMRHVALSQTVAPNDMGALAAALSAMLGKISDDVADGLAGAASARPA